MQRRLDRVRRVVAALPDLSTEHRRAERGDRSMSPYDAAVVVAAFLIGAGPFAWAAWRWSKLTDECLGLIDEQAATIREQREFIDLFAAADAGEQER
jgi:hypothetical protein